MAASKRGDAEEGPNVDVRYEKENTRQRRPNAYWQRIQAFITSPLPNFSNGTSKATHLSEVNHSESSPLQPQNLKIRIISWNMHDSLPKGNIEELLGKVPKYSPPTENQEPRIPQFDPAPDHPYHIIVVAGQECPTVSGIPMGIAGFKLKDKDRKSKLNLSTHLHRHKSSPVAGAEGQPQSASPNPSTDVILETSPSISASNSTSQNATSGWSSILEDWFCRGVGTLEGAKPVILDGSEVRDDDSAASAQPSPAQHHHIGLAWHTAGSFEHGIPKPASTSGIGPYQLLAKDRLMGIYLAVFIHRELAPFIRATSKSTVATGLMRGRIGNKGGVGISVDVDGTRLLFINAHLAAHEDHVAMRLANFSRIKTELMVNTFLPPNDPRELSEDVTDRFDHTFLCGDLNFRLDLSRLHADWLIAQKDYAQALKFDQLRKVMECKQNFMGFQEGLIDFPPTYKFDVLKTMKQARSKKRFSLKDRSKEATAFEEDVGDDTKVDMPNRFYGMDTSSAISSVPTEAMSRDTRTTEANDDSSSSDESLVDASNDKTKGQSSGTALGLGIGGLLDLPAALKTTGHHLLDIMKNSRRPYRLRSVSVTAIRSSKSSPSVAPGSTATTSQTELDAPFHATVVSSTPRTPSFYDEHTSTTVELPVPQSTSYADILLPPHSHSVGDLHLVDDSDGASIGSPRKAASLLQRSRSIQNRNPDASLETNEMKSDGVYDSSSKQRVPSWCDRILWKTGLYEDSTSVWTHVVPVNQKPSMKRWSTMIPRRHSVSSSTSKTKLDIVHSSVKGKSIELALTPRSTKRNFVGNVTEEDYRKSRLPALFSGLHKKSSRPGQMPKSISLDVPAYSLVPEDTTKISLQSNDEAEPSQLSNESTDQVHAMMSPLPVTSRPLGRSESLPPVQNVAAIRSTSSSHLGTAATVSRYWLFGLLRRGSSNITNSEETNNLPVVSETQHHKGDIDCLDYGTLDDAAMRRLEGRSDHRPILGTYSVYI